MILQILGWSVEMNIRNIGNGYWFEAENKGANYLTYDNPLSVNTTQAKVCYISKVLEKRLWFEPCKSKVIVNFQTSKYNLGPLLNKKGNIH